ncbi:MAG: hypothetical protein E5W70_30155 [Mesorhizobium sp.]|uniref:nuclear transport factor 2 family protein n=1 Tax=Mesorhizobium sp. TaxID=1871066 RepID=UPI0011F67C13|nr:nuclear transport factor 2 family protein [Mesorhizobium sp.]TIT18180.1 MAG: hypothetical protein E5W70_30155 [Mesorhizobium sp.]
MNDCKEFFSAYRSTMIALTLCLGMSVVVSGAALAVECTKKMPDYAPSDGPTFQWGGADLSADDRADIEDLFSRYAWALDERNAENFAGLFAKTGRYEVCTGGGNTQVFTAPANEIETTMQGEFAALASVFQPRHFLSNTLLRASKTGEDALDSKTTMLVTIQRLEGDRVLPEPDYTADVRATLLRDSDQNWRFNLLVVYADTPVFEPMGR